MCIHHGILASKYMVTLGICSIECEPETICKSLQKGSDNGPMTETDLWTSAARVSWTAPEESKVGRV